MQIIREQKRRVYLTLVPETFAVLERRKPCCWPWLRGSSFPREDGPLCMAPEVVFTVTYCIFVWTLEFILKRNVETMDTIGWLYQFKAQAVWLIYNKTVFWAFLTSIFHDQMVKTWTVESSLATVQYVLAFGTGVAISLTTKCQAQQ